jgi:hypothetical protein
MKIPDLKSQYVWLTVALLAYLIPGVFPLGTGFPMSDTTMEIYEIVKNLPEGSICAIGGSGVFAFDLESSAGTIPALKIMAENGVRIINVPLGTEAVQYEKFLIDASRIEKKYGGTLEYGKDWIQFPYIPGGSSGLVAFLEDIHTSCPVDVYGTPLDELPLGQELTNWEDIDLWICPHWGFPTIVQYVTGERGITSISFAQSGAYSTYSPYMMSYPGQVYMTNGFLGGAQMERLVGMKGLGHAAIDAYQVLSILFVVFVALGNATAFTTEEEE